MSTTPTDPARFHADSARNRQEDATVAGYGTDVEAYNLKAAHVQAMLALAEEQRTANLIAVLNGSATGWSAGIHLTSNQRDWARAQVASRLGLPEPVEDPF